MTPEQIAAITNAVVAALAQDTPEVPTPAPAKKRTTKGNTTKGNAQKGQKVYRWAPWACSRFGIPAKVGGTFDYTSARNGETHTHKVTKVAADGKVESVRTD